MNMALVVMAHFFTLCRWWTTTIPSINRVNLNPLLGMDTGLSVAATVDRVLAQEDQRRQLNSADMSVRRLSFNGALGRNIVHTGSRLADPNRTWQSSSRLPGSFHRLIVSLRRWVCTIYTKGDDNGLKPVAGPLGTPCTALFQFVASTKVHAISLRSPFRFWYLIFLKALAGILRLRRDLEGHSLYAILIYGT